MSIYNEFIRQFGKFNMAESCNVKDMPFVSDIKRFLDEYEKPMKEVLGASIRCVDETWREDPRPVRDGTKMVMIPEVIFNRLEKAIVSAMKENTENFYILEKIR